MIDRKIWKGDMLNLAAGNSFWGGEIVAHRAGSCIAVQDSEEGEELVEISGGYSVKRADLYELSDRECRAAHLYATIAFAGLQGISPEERRTAAEELIAMKKEEHG